MFKQARWLMVAAVVASTSVVLVARDGGKDPNAGPTRDEKRLQAREDDRPRRGEKFLDEEQEKAFLQELKDTDSRAYEWLVKLKERNPRRYRWALYARWVDHQRTKRMPEKVQQAHQTLRSGKRVIAGLIGQYRSATDEDVRSELKTKIEAAVEKVFDADLVMRSYQLEQLEERLKDLKEEIVSLKENRQQQIDKHVERLLEGKLGRPRGRRRGPGGGHPRRQEQ